MERGHVNSLKRKIRSADRIKLKQIAEKLLSEGLDTPKEVIDRVHAAVVKITAQQVIRDRFGALGATTLGNSPAEFGEYIRQDYAKMQKVVAAANIRAD